MNIIIDNPNKIFSNLNFEYDGINLITASDDNLENNINTLTNQHTADLVLILQNNLALRIRGNSTSLDKQVIIPKTEHLMNENKSYFTAWMQDNDLKYLLPLPVKGQPAILKRGSSRSGQDVILYENYEDACKHAVDGDVVQRAVPGWSELAIHVVARHGKLKDIIVFEHNFSSVTDNKIFIRGHNLRNKDIKIHDFKFTKDIQHILQKMAFDGVACFDGKIENNQLFLFEMNTRIGGSMFFYNHMHHKLKPFLSSIKQAFAA